METSRMMKIIDADVRQYTFSMEDCKYSQASLSLSLSLVFCKSNLISPYDLCSPVVCADHGMLFHSHQV